MKYIFTPLGKQKNLKRENVTSNIQLMLNMGYSYQEDEE